jgi:hypothetical protein
MQREKAVNPPQAGARIFSYGNRARCPICGRVIDLVAGATNMRGERIMTFHYANGWNRCDGSKLSVRAATEKAKSALPPVADGQSNAS